jgi:hypothetical protein
MLTCFRFILYYVFCDFICLAASTALSITAVIVIVATLLVWTTNFVTLVLSQVSAESSLISICFVAQAAHATTVDLFSNIVLADVISAKWKNIRIPETNIYICECSMYFMCVPLIHWVQSGQWRSQETKPWDKDLDEESAIQGSVEEYKWGGQHMIRSVVIRKR